MSTSRYRCSRSAVFLNPLGPRALGCLSFEKTLLDLKRSRRKSFQKKATDGFLKIMATSPPGRRRGRYKLKRGYILENISGLFKNSPFGGPRVSYYSKTLSPLLKRGERKALRNKDATGCQINSEGIFERILPSNLFANPWLLSHLKTAS